MSQLALGYTSFALRRSTMPPVLVRPSQPLAGRLFWCLLAAILTFSGAQMAAANGRVVPIAGATTSGDVSTTTLASPVVGLSATSTGDGYWMVAADGGVFTFGDAPFYGSMGNVSLNRPVVAMATTPSGNGYWLVASDGGVFTFGDAGYHGSTGNIALNQQIVGMASTQSGEGYWLVAADGGIFTFGDAPYLGSTGNITLNRPIVGMAASPTGGGYWLVASDGGIFTFGDVGYHGSAPAIGSTSEFVDLIAATNGDGYSLVASDGSVTPFGSATTGPLLTAASCDRDPVQAAAPSGSGLLLLRNEVPVPGGAVSAASSANDSHSIDAILQHAQACQSQTALQPGQLSTPFPHPFVTSSYGTRRHPIWRVVQLHAGVDLGNLTGTLGQPVLASADALVVAIDNRIAYGTAIVLDHGGRIATVYGHLQSTTLSVGDVVSRGQTIGLAGSTGFSTGAHLHFEVRVNGQPVDPAAFVSVS